MLMGGGAPGIHQATFEAILTGNTIGPLGTNTAAAQAQGIALNGGTNVGDIFDIYLELGGAGSDKNTVNNWTASNGQDDIRIRQRQSTTVHLTAASGTSTTYSGGTTDTAAIALHSGEQHDDRTRVGNSLWQRRWFRGRVPAVSFRRRVRSLGTSH